jgi:uncharacterized protein
METKKIIFKTKNKKEIPFECEHAKSFFQKTKGLMNRKELSENKGMFFSFCFPWIRFFWMKNVKIPLDIIFINHKKEIIKIYEAPVETGFFCKNYCSMGFCKYVVETNMGFCKKHNISKGDKIIILD